jgi:hypothetical protein
MVFLLLTYLHNGLILSCPPTSCKIRKISQNPASQSTHNPHTQTLNFTFLYVTVSTLNPTVGIVVTD